MNNEQFNELVEKIGIKPYHQEPSGVIYCGDCLEVMKQIPDGAVDLVWTDPPYGHNNNNNDMISNREAIFGGKNKPQKVDESEYRPIANDGPEANEIFQAVLPTYNRLLKPGCCCCCCGGGGGPDPQFARWSLWLDAVIPFKMMVVWDKGPMGMGHHYRRSYETILIAQKRGSACHWFDSSKKIENIIRPGDYGIAKIIPTAQQHPTIKPVQLPKHFIRLHTKRDELVLDPFLGSGTTAVAAKQLGRKFIGIEISEEYSKIAEDRLRQEELF